MRRRFSAEPGRALAAGSGHQVHGLGQRDDATRSQRVGEGTVTDSVSLTTLDNRRAAIEAAFAIAFAAAFANYRVAGSAKAC